jgi:glycosyltransferase involved in cell wall biosynthesis
MKREIIRVMHTCPLGTGGITNLVLNICEKIDKSILNFDYLTYRYRTEFAEARALSFGGKKYVADNEKVKLRFFKFWVKFIRSYKVFKNSQTDIFHINASTPYDTLVGIAAKMAGVKKVVVHSHNASNSSRTKVKDIVNHIAKFIMPLYADAYFTCSTEAAKYLFPAKIFKTHDYIYIKNGIDTNRFKFDSAIREKIRNENNWNDKFVICNVGRLTKQKNQLFLIDVFYEITKKKDNAILLLIGIGELEEELRSRAQSYGITDRVVFWGATKEVRNLLQAADVYVMTSLHEGLPVSGIEAQTSGLPCVFANTITKEVGINKECTFVSLNESAQYWAEEIIKKSDLVIDRNMGCENAKNSGFDISNVANMMTDYYIELLNQ